MVLRFLSIVFIFFLSCYAWAQNPVNLQSVSISNNDDFAGYDIIDTDNSQVFVLAEHWHNIGMVPRATMKILRYLHKNANVRILAIEQGASVAHMINSYLHSGDTITLRKIARNTMFWGKEHWDFFTDLYHFNESIPSKDRIFVKSIDIEYKMESAIFVINELIGKKTIPTSLKNTLGVFQQLFQDSKAHREQFQGISVMYYYDRELVETLVLATLNELEQKSEVYTNFFGKDFVQFATLILEMDDGLTFDYTNPNNNYKFRDRLIYKKFISLVEEYPKTGILCVIGMRHATKGSSIHKLDHLTFSPLYGSIKTIKVSALLNKMIISSDLRKVNFNFPYQLKSNEATLIKHKNDDMGVFKSGKSFDYTLFINDNGEITPFDKVYKEGYRD